jgi:hypothetical protein
MAGCTLQAPTQRDHGRTGYRLNRTTAEMRGPARGKRRGA